MTNIKELVLSIDQMEYLKELGLNVENTSMCWVKNLDSKNSEVFVYDEFIKLTPNLQIVPTMTLEEIIDMIRYLSRSITTIKFDFKIDEVFLEYQNDIMCIKDTSNLLESMYNCLCKILENGH